MRQYFVEGKTQAEMCFRDQRKSNRIKSKALRVSFSWEPAYWKAGLSKLASSFPCTRDLPIPTVSFERRRAPTCELVTSGTRNSTAAIFALGTLAFYSSPLEPQESQRRHLCCGAQESWEAPAFGSPLEKKGEKSEGNRGVSSSSSSSRRSGTRLVFLD